MSARLSTTTRSGPRACRLAPAIGREPSRAHRRARAPRGWRRRLTNERGFTLVEVLIVSAILPIVLIGILAPFEFAQRQTPKNVEYAQAISEEEQGLQQMMREIRQAYRVNSTTPNSIDFNAVIGTKDLEIFYECEQPYPSNLGNPNYKEYRRCVRVSAATGTALPSLTKGTVAIDRLLNGTDAAPVFTFKDSQGNVDPTNPTYIEANIRVPARGSLSSGLKHTIELHNGTTVPNLVIPK